MFSNTKPRPKPEHVTDRDNVVLKAVMHELALHLSEIDLPAVDEEAA